MATRVGADSRAVSDAVDTQPLAGRADLAVGVLPPRQPVQVLFAEARRRRRRIRLARLVCVALAIGVAAIGAARLFHSPGPSDTGLAPAGTGGAAGAAARYSVVAWVDGNFRLHLGNLTTRTQHGVTEINADPGIPLVQAAGRLYWVNQGGGYVQGAFWPTTVEELNLATGESAEVGPGEFVFPAADGRHLYISLTDDSLAEIPVPGQPGHSQQLTLPAGWYLPGGYSLAVAGGIVVQSSDDRAGGRPALIAVWNLRTGQLRVIGAGVAAIGGPPMGAAIGAYTPRQASYSLLAWMPASCRYPLNCPIRITNTGTLKSVALRSPVGHGFALGGAFSPNGKRLAVFLNANAGDGGGMAELAIADAATGALRVVSAARYPLGEDLGWARWLPGGKQLIVIGADGPYLVDTQTLATRALSFARHGAQSINFSATVIPPRG